MKVFDLVCPDGHRFEGWFASADRFHAQREAHEVKCPLCDSSDVHREPSAPRLNFGGPSPIAPQSTPPSPTGNAPVALPPFSRQVMDQLRRLVAQTEDVGPRFAEEARRIHYDETPARPIRGSATDRERQDLHDEGIETVTLPIPRALTETLQ